jgi:UDP-2,3-diacylglucosamine pyrophosphatase LpxH
MLVVISDIHLTDNSTARNVHASAFDLLVSEIKAAAIAKKATELKIVLLGDIFDLVRTDYWHRKTEMKDRPWGGDLDPATGMNRETARIQPQFEQVLDGVLGSPEGQALVAMLNRELANATGFAPEVTYVVGNHDRVFNNFPSLRDKVKAALPAVRSLGFDNSFRSDEYGVFARHGHEWDENCHGFAFYNKVLKPKAAAPLGRFDPAVYRVMAIGEVVTAELMSGLVHYARAAQPSSTPEWSRFIETFKDLNNLRPTTDVFAWLDWFARGQLAAYKPALHTALRHALNGVLDSPLGKRWDALATDFLVTGDLTDRLSFLRSHILGNSFDEFSSRVRSLGKILSLVDKVSDESDDYATGAESEWSAAGGQGFAAIQYLLYGHTHKARHVTISAAPDGRVRMYINTGTLLPLIQRSSSRDGFSTAAQMTVAFFYRADEDKNGRADLGPTLDLWVGVRRKAYTLA